MATLNCIECGKPYTWRKKEGYRCRPCLNKAQLAGLTRRADFAYLTTLERLLNRSLWNGRLEVPQ